MNKRQDDDERANHPENGETPVDGKQKEGNGFDQLLERIIEDQKLVAERMKRKRYGKTR